MSADTASTTEIRREPPRPALTVPEVAAWLRVSEAKVWGLIRRGEIDSFKVDSSRRFLHEAVETYIREHSEGNGHQA